MHFLINGKIHFRDTDGALWMEDADSDMEQITLTITTSRLLRYLLERHGEVAAREDILEMVWTAHGLRSSNNSLNKYIADLRKVFTNFGLTEDVIITIPRIGFMFAREIPVVADQAQESNDDMETVLLSSEPDEIVQRGARGFSLRSRTIFILFFLTIIGLVPAMLARTEKGRDFLGLNTLSETAVYFLGTVDGCKVFSMRQNSVEMTRVKLDLVNELIEKKGIACLGSSTFFFQPSDPVIYGHPGRVFLARCTHSSTTPGEFASCKNFYGINFIHD
ncbi:winged helix-turn-helix domain-containing protein [Enterobacter kobei]|uniref:winged helix-turn-helix domain-containing protein n=1 Tax=Enterobacter kobei TaxID=208224 RepID=UPI003BEF4A5D